MRHQIKGANGNCAALDDTNILYTTRDCTVINENNTDTLDISTARRYDLDLHALQDDEVELLGAPDFGSLSPYKEAAIGYIAGYVVRMVDRRIQCLFCTAALQTQGPLDETYARKVALITCKNKGGLIRPSTSVINVYVKRPRNVSSTC